MKAETARRGTAKAMGLTSCTKCGACCYARTCIPTPDEMPKIAEHMQISPQELAKQYMVIDSKGDCYFLRFANTSQSDILGKYIPDHRTYDMGDCVFFSPADGCRIHDVKPEYAHDHKCWEPEGNGKPWDSWQASDVERFLPGVDLGGDD